MWGGEGVTATPTQILKTQRLKEQGNVPSIKNENLKNKFLKKTSFPACARAISKHKLVERQFLSKFSGCSFLWKRSLIQPL
jgi:hypothetical protein